MGTFPWPWEHVYAVVLIILYPRKWEPTSPIHTDSDDENSDGVVYNIPILGCEDAYTISYKLKEGQSPNKSEIMPGGTRPYVIYTEDQVEKIGEIRYGHNTTNLIDTSQPHKVTNYPNTIRIMTSFRWNPPLRWDDIDPKITGL